jgi:hypothetical protein
MKVFLDTAELTEIERAAEAGLIDGITTNPSLMASAAGEGSRWSTSPGSANWWTAPSRLKLWLPTPKGWWRKVPAWRGFTTTSW